MSARPGAQPPSGSRFPASLRLRRSEDISRVLASGRRLTGKLMIIHAKRHDGVTSRLGVSISRKVGGAVVRNRLRRRLREMFRLRLRAHLDETCGPVDILVRPLPAAAAAPARTLEDEAMELVSRWSSRRVVRGAGPR